MVRRLIVSLAAGAALLAACADEPLADYSQEAKDDFLAGCVDPVSDELLTFRLCQCTFERLEEQVVFARLEEIEQLLLANPEAPLPDEVSEIMADCVLEEVEL